MSATLHYVTTHLFLFLGASTDPGKAFGGWDGMRAQRRTNALNVSGIPTIIGWLPTSKCPPRRPRRRRRRASLTFRSDDGLMVDLP